MERNKTLAAAISMLAATGLTACGGGGGGGGSSSDNSGPLAVSGDVTDLNGRGDWGGLVVDGFAPVNSADTPGAAPPDGSVASEAVPDGESRYFGGDDAADNSGHIRHLIIAESGYAFRADQEVQGLTLEGVGSGTTETDGGPFVDYLQVLGSEDDGVEWFGGAAGIDHVVINGQDDDGLDQDLGWQGEVQYALVLMGSENGNRAMETDGNGDNFDATPYTNPQIANLTVIGNSGKDSNQTQAHLAREGYRGNIYRSVYTDGGSIGGNFANGCVDVDEMSGSSWDTDSPLTYTNMVINCNSGVLTADETGDSAETDATNESWQKDFQAEVGNLTFDVTSGSGSLDPATLAFDGSGLTISGTPGSGATAESNDYVGAVNPSVSDVANTWWHGWTYRNSNVDGNLPGSDFHPLQAEIGSSITPASSANCPVGEARGTTSVFGTAFPVCWLSGDITSDVTLTNDHIYVLEETVNVGDGGAESGPSGNNNAVLTIEKGTQIMGASGTGTDDVALVITRGSQIKVNGTEAEPVIMGGLEVE
jgi:hypothetical protein